MHHPTSQVVSTSTSEAIQRRTTASTLFVVKDADAWKLGEAITDALGCLNRLDPG